MRKANISDMFHFARFLKEMDVKDIIFNSAKGDIEDIEKIGFDMMWDIFEKLISKKAEKALYEVVSNPFQMTVEEISRMDFVPFLETFTECYDIKTLINFIKRAFNSN